MYVGGVRKGLKTEVILKCRDGMIIQRVEKMKYLGVIIDGKLRWEDHCDYILK